MCGAEMGMAVARALASVLWEMAKPVTILLGEAQRGYGAFWFT